MTITTPEDDTVTIFETDSKGSSRMSVAQGGSEISGFISIGDVSYFKNLTDSNWTKFTKSTTEESDDNPVSELESEFDFDSDLSKDTSKFSKQGKEACGDLTCFKYLITDTSAPGEDVTVWFDDEEYKLRRMTTNSSDGTSNIVFEYEVSEITEPSPIVEAPDYENMSAKELQQLMQQYTQ